MSAPPWLTRRPVAHRGLHGGAVAENTLAAVEAAIAADYAVEVDLQLTADGGLAVAHDATLDRTTHDAGPILARTLAELRAIPLAGSDETLSSLADLLALTSGRAALLIELKAPPRRADKARMTAAIASALGGYGGAAAVMTFDPELLGMLLRALPDTPRGILAGGEDPAVALPVRLARDMMLHAARTQPDFVGYYAPAMPHPGPGLARRFGHAVLAWTVRSRREADRLAPYVDQIIFEEFYA